MGTSISTLHTVSGALYKHFVSGDIIAFAWHVILWDHIITLSNDSCDLDSP